MDGIIYEFDHQLFSEDQYSLLIDHFSKDLERTLRLIKGEFTLFFLDLTSGRVIIATAESGNAAFLFRRSGEFLIFSNSLTEILKPDLGSKEINFQRIHDIMTGSRLGSEETCYSDIIRLLPGYYLTCKNKSITINGYTSLFSIDRHHQLCADPYIQFREIFDQAVRIRLMGNRIGSALSSGKDSTAVTAMAASALREDQKLYGYTFKPGLLPVKLLSDNRYNETVLLKSFFKRYPKVISNEVEPGPGSILDSLERSIEIYGEPVYGASNQFWVQHMHNMLREDGCSSMLTGQGGNYSISWPPPELVARKRKLNQGIIKALLWTSSSSQKIPYVSTGFLNEVKDNGFSELVKATDLQDLQPIFLKNSISYTGFLQKQVSLYHGFHITDPTVDKDLVEFCLSLPLEAYHNSSGSRNLITCGMRDMLPGEILNNPVRSIQASDIQFRVHRERDQLFERLVFLNKNKLVTFVLEMDRLVGDWESLDFLRMKRKKLNHLLRILMIGIFLSQFED
ncbi:MAG: hypothetical protein KAR19_07705 [Bacteroidales bacterium]|nr:hypothetical protein [Bacteroidales bacterium]